MSPSYRTYVRVSSRRHRYFAQARNDTGFPSTLAEAPGVVENERRLGLTVQRAKVPVPIARCHRQDGGQRCSAQWRHDVNPFGGEPTGSLPASSAAVGISILEAHSASSWSDMGHVS